MVLEGLQALRLHDRPDGTADTKSSKAALLPRAATIPDIVRALEEFSFSQRFRSSSIRHLRGNVVDLPRVYPPLPPPHPPPPHPPASATTAPSALVEWSKIQAPGLHGESILLAGRLRCRAIACQVTRVPGTRYRGVTKVPSVTFSHPSTTRAITHYGH